MLLLLGLQKPQLWPQFQSEELGFFQPVRGRSIRTEGKFLAVMRGVLSEERIEGWDLARQQQEGSQAVCGASSGCWETAKPGREGGGCEPGARSPPNPVGPVRRRQKTTHSWPLLRPPPMVSHGSADSAYNLNNRTVLQPVMFHPLVTKKGAGHQNNMKEAAKTSGGAQGQSRRCGQQ